MLLDDPDNRHVMIDSTMVRAHQQAAWGGAKVRTWAVQRRTEHQDTSGGDALGRLVSPSPVIRGPMFPRPYPLGIET